MNINETSIGKYKKARCPFCGKEINFATTQKIDYDKQQTDNRVWCYKCERYVKFSLK